jgi:hypothetical protein
MLQRICLKRTSSQRKRSRIHFGQKKKKGKAFGEGGEVLIMQKPKLPPPMFNNGREKE